MNLKINLVRDPIQPNTAKQGHATCSKLIMRWPRGSKCYGNRKLKGYAERSQEGKAIVCVRVEEDIIRHQKMVVKEENPNP